MLPVIAYFDGYGRPSEVTNLVDSQADMLELLRDFLGHDFGKEKTEVSASDGPDLSTPMSVSVRGFRCWNCRTSHLPAVFLRLYGIAAPDLTCI